MEKHPCAALKGVSPTKVGDESQNTIGTCLCTAMTFAPRKRSVLIEKADHHPCRCRFLSLPLSLPLPLALPLPFSEMAGGAVARMAW